MTFILMKIRQLSFDYLKILKAFWSICNYEVNTSWFDGIFERGLIFDNILTIVDLTEILHSGIIWFYIKIAHKDKIFILS